MNIHSITDNGRDCYISLNELVMFLSVVNTKDVTAEDLRTHLISELHRYKEIFEKEMNKR